MKNLFRSLLVLMGCIVLANCVNQEQFKGLKADYTKLQTEYQESQLQLRENQVRSTSLEERLVEVQRNNSELRKSLSDMQSILSKSLTQNSQRNMNTGKLIGEINVSNRFIQHSVREKNGSDSLNLIMVSKLTRSLARGEMRDLGVKVLKGVAYISLVDNTFYKSGSYEISNEAEAAFSKITKIIQDYKDHDAPAKEDTDTDPISRTNVRNSWDLSALRASSIIQTLQSIYGVNPKCLITAGRGELNPVAGNDTVEGKTRNRRTEVIIVPKLDQFMDLIDRTPDNSSSGMMGDENTKE